MAGPGKGPCPTLHDQARRLAKKVAVGGLLGSSGSLDGQYLFRLVQHVQGLLVLADIVQPCPFHAVRLHLVQRHVDHSLMRKALQTGTYGGRRGSQNMNNSH